MVTAPWWLRFLLAAAVVGPATGFVAWSVYGVHGTEGWATATDAPGFALCGTFGLAAVAAGVAWLAGRTFVLRDGEGHAVLAGGCTLAAGLLTLSLIEAAAVGLGLKDGRVPPAVLAGVGGAWLYLVAVGLGHWHLSRALPARRTRKP
ncbi:MAG: hypothetical protein ACRC33_05410 [Gemmataceae bacterium]